MQLTEAEGCPHIEEHLGTSAASTTGILSKYENVMLWGFKATYERVRLGAKRRKLSTPTCQTCHLAVPRVMICLHCSYSGCWASGHAISHMKNTGHGFSADIKSGSVFCSECDDFIYHRILDNIHLRSTLSAEEKRTQFLASKKPRDNFKAWAPTAKDSDSLQGSELAPCQARRGLLNLGQTCFLNVVLQCLVHNPLLRNYFLSDKHNHRLCKNKIEECTCCEMDKLFIEMYSDNPTPFGPISFLQTTWRASTELSGYSQQDAHECFMSILNQIHSTSRGNTNISCNCIIHSTFAGSLQSEVRCEKCGNVTTAVDPVLDISLELKGSASNSEGENTLAACLRRYTKPEKLAAKEYSCAKCAKASHEASKTLSIRKLPPVLSFQFKRFEHKTGDKTTSMRKIDEAVRFPASLNMAPYTSLVMKQLEKENSNNNSRHLIPNSLGPNEMYEYELFAVINHEGQMNNGHYTNFARFGDEWYRFDDDKVTHTTLGSCLASSTAAYMCFYVKRHLDYKPYMTPTYVQTREADIVREKEMEKEKEMKRAREIDDALLATV